MRGPAEAEKDYSDSDEEILFPSDAFDDPPSRKISGTWLHADCLWRAFCEAGEGLTANSGSLRKHLRTHTGGTPSLVWFKSLKG